MQQLLSSSLIQVIGQWGKVASHKKFGVHACTLYTRYRYGGALPHYCAHVHVCRCAYAHVYVCVWLVGCCTMLVQDHNPLGLKWPSGQMLSNHPMPRIILANTRPHQLRWGDRECGYYTSSLLIVVPPHRNRGNNRHSE